MNLGISGGSQKILAIKVQIFKYFKNPVIQVFLVFFELRTESYEDKLVHRVVSPGSWPYTVV